VEYSSSRLNYLSLSPEAIFEIRYGSHSASVLFVLFRPESRLATSIPKIGDLFGPKPESPTGAKRSYLHTTLIDVRHRGISLKVVLSLPRFLHIEWNQQLNRFPAGCCTAAPNQGIKSSIWLDRA